jgi:hypothetical protein
MPKQTNETREVDLISLHADVAILQKQVEDLHVVLSDLKGQLSNMISVTVEIKSVIDKSRGFALAFLLIVSGLAWIIDHWTSLKNGIHNIFS